MAPFSAAVLKEKASSLRNSGSDKFQNVRAKYASRSSADSSYDHRDLGTKALPPPSRIQESHEDATSDLRSQSARPPPPVRRSTRPTNPQISSDRYQAPAGLQSTSEGIKWSTLSSDDKATFFGWLDEFFEAKKTSSNVSQTQTAVKSPPAQVERQGSDSFSMSHPSRTEQGSAGEDLSVYFSSGARWDTAWYSSENPQPPPLAKVADCIRSYSTRWRGDIHTLAGGVLFSDLSAAWYSVEWSGRNAHNTASARRKATFIPRPDALSQGELVAAHETYGETVAGFAEGYEGTGQWCARGECWDLASEALKSFEQWDYVAKPIPSIGLTHGHLIFEGKAWGKNAHTQQAGRWRGGDDRIRRGDIVQWKSVTISEGYRKSTLGQPDHTAIIVREQKPLITPADGRAMRPADLGCLEVVEQSVHSPPSRQTYQLGGMEAGELWIYRPIGMVTYIGLEFSPEWPEGLQATANA